MRQGRAAILAALLLWTQLAGTASGEDVTLRSRDGAVSLSGELLGFDGDFYRLHTRYGELTVDGSGVTCDGSDCPSVDDYVAELTVSGSAAAGGVLLPALLHAFALSRDLETRRAQVDDRSVRYDLFDPASTRVTGRFTFRTGSTDEGFADLLADEADVVAAAREIHPPEIERGRAAGLGTLDDPNRSRVLALDAAIPVVAPANPVTEISMRELAQVLDGSIRNWRHLGGANAPITLHVPGDRSGFALGVTEFLRASGDRSISPFAVTHLGGEALTGAIAEDPFGLGIVSHSELGDVKPLSLAGECGFDLHATRRTIKAEDYPLTAPIFLYMPARRLPALAREFLSFTRSEPAQIVIRRAGFVDQSPEQVPLALQGERLANAISVTDGSGGLAELRRMVRTLRPMQRLTTTFRFEPGATRLDAQSRSNVYQLAHAIEAGTYDARRLVFVGFSDGIGSADTNRDIARERAAAVRAAVITAAETAELDRISLGTDAFGEAMPIACNDTGWGRKANRRVEVWLR